LHDKVGALLNNALGKKTNSDVVATAEVDGKDSLSEKGGEYFDKLA